VQVDSDRPTLKAPRTKRLKLQHDKLLSNFAFNFNLRRYSEAGDPLAEQVRQQLETLVKEKSQLAQENAALRRENESLQELLMYSNMASTAGPYTRPLLSST